jgi:hypothetical protein
MRGSLETFSLPELFQLIESGKKSGKLSFNPGLKNADPEIQGVFELWFDQGNFVAVVNSLKYQAMIAEIQDRGWIDSRLLIKTKYSCPKNLPLCIYLQQEKLLTLSQVDLLFNTQLNSVRKLFNVDSAWFKLEEFERNSTALGDEEFPWKEMTGKQKITSELSLEAMRDFTDWKRFKEDLPLGTSGLQKLIKDQDLQLVHLENKLWNTADGTITLKNIAKETATPLEQVQQTALSMIFAGLVEEIPMVNSAIKTSNVPQLSSQTAFAGNSNTATKPAVKSTVSNSLINNLVSFLRNNF